MSVVNRPGTAALKVAEIDTTNMSFGHSTATFYGWRVVAAVFVLAAFGWGFGFYGPPVYLQAVHGARGWPLALIAAAVTFHFLFGALVVANLPGLLIGTASPVLAPAARVRGVSPHAGASPGELPPVGRRARSLRRYLALQRLNHHGQRRPNFRSRPNSTVVARPGAADR